MVESVVARAVWKQVGAVTGLVKGQVVAVRGAGAVRRDGALRVVEQGEWNLAEALDWPVADAQTHADMLLYLDL